MDLQHFKEFKEKESAERAAREAKSSQIAGWVSAVTGIVATSIAVIALFKS